MKLNTDSDANLPPEAAFSYDPSAPTNETTITFDAGDSSDSDGSISSYEWDFTADGSVDESGTTATHSFSTPGSYEVTLTVTDDGGKTDILTQTISVTAEDSGMVEAPGGITIPSEYASGPDNTVGPSGLGSAAADFREGKIGPGTLGDIATAFRNS